MSQVYTFISVMHLFSLVWPFMSMNLHGFMHTSIVGVLHYMIPPFSMFQDGSNYIIFPGREMDIMIRRILLSLCIGQLRSVVSGRESIQQKHLVLCISRFRSILIISISKRGGEKRVAIELERRFCQ